MPAEQVFFAPSGVSGRGKLIYDKTGLDADVARPRLRFRFHPGSETQLPDPLIEAQVGEGRAPAHRGLCYLVFEELQLADFGNRIPNLTAEIVCHEIVRRLAALPWLVPALQHRSV